MDIKSIVLQSNNFTKFNPMQLKALKKDLFNSSLVVASPTASGKTILAELTALYSIINQKKKVIYTCPLRALASEHFNDFKKKYSTKQKIRMALTTGDFDSSSKYLSRYDLIFSTNEKIDSLTRHKADWLKNVGLLIVDEVHELGGGRGATLEMIITKLRMINPELKILALSATIPNAKELSDWLSAELVESDYRPVKLKEGVFFEGNVLYENDFEKLQGPKSDPLKTIFSDVFAKEKQALVFANTRKRAESIANQYSSLAKKSISSTEKKKLEKLSNEVLNVLEQPTEQCRKLSSLVKSGVSFHHAGLLGKQRELIEGSFKDGVIKFISSTPTLAAGINMPAHTVIIPSLYRYTSMGMQRIPVGEYKQMCLPYNSKIITKEFGELSIGEIVENKIDCHVLSFNLKRKKLEFKKVKKYFNNGKKRLINIKTSLGNNIKLTQNHPILVKEKDEFNWKIIKKLKEGDKIISWKNDSLPFTKPPYFLDLLDMNSTYVVGLGNLVSVCVKKLKLTEKELANKLNANYKLMYHWKNNKKAIPLKYVLRMCDFLNYSIIKKVSLIKNVKTAHGKVIVLPKRVNKEFLWLTGFLASDGNINRQIDKRSNSEHITLRFFNKNKKLIDEAIKIIKSFGLNYYLNKRSDDLYSLEVSSKLLAKILNTHFGVPYGKKSFSVEIPEFLINLKPDFIGAYIGGVFDGDGNYNEAFQKYKSKIRRVLITTSSKKFARGIQNLLLRLGIIANITSSINTLSGKRCYNIIFRKIEYIKKFVEHSKIIKIKIKSDYSNYNNIREFHDKTNNEFVEVEISTIKKGSIQKVYNLQVENNENYFADNFLVHNCGRAGRPKFDSEGRSIVFARSEDEQEEILESFILGEIENVNSQLGYSPILRMHILALIASDFVQGFETLKDFFSKTFYSKQFGGIKELSLKLEEIIYELESLNFVRFLSDNVFTATPLGKRVSDLYLDPLSADKMISSLKESSTDKALLFTLVNTSEFKPYFSVAKILEQELFEELLISSNELPIDVQKEQFQDPDLIKKFNSTLLLKDWISEIKEDILMDEYNTQPGILHAKLQIIDWLVYAAIELSKILNLNESMISLIKLRKRIKYGIKEELLPLIDLKGIGRVRARKLFKANIHSINSLQKTDLKDLERIIPPKIALSIKKQLGQA